MHRFRWERPAVSPSQLVGLSAAVIAGYAYLPQIAHLVREHCSAGLSERAYALWLASSLLMTVHAVTIGSVVFVILGVQQVVSTGVVAFFCRRYRDQTCPSHSPSPLAAESAQVLVPLPRRDASAF
jgi:hypothetical protein